MPLFKPGDPKPPNSGRKKGTTNKNIMKAREAFSLAFDELGGVDALVRWARNNKGDFYKMYARMIPLEVSGPNGGPIRASFEQAVRAASGLSQPIEEAEHAPSALPH